MVTIAAAIAGGLALLAFAPDRFVAGSAGLADRWGMSRLVIGAVVIGFGTSAPEMLVSGLAALQDEPDVGVGNIIGSNMANLSLVVGVAALVGPMAVPRGLLRREMPLMIAATVIFAVAVQGRLHPLEGVVLLAALAVALWAIVRGSLTAATSETELDHEIEEFLAPESTQPVSRMAVDVAVGLIGTLVGAQLLISGAVEIADRAGLSGGFVGLTIVALGTSLPELVTAIAAARAGEDQLILGNVLGSNMFNSLGVGAVVALANPGSLDDAKITVGAVLLMLAITALATAILARGRIVTRVEAVVLLVAYVAFLPFLAG